MMRTAIAAFSTLLASSASLAMAERAAPITHEYSMRVNSNALTLFDTKGALSFVSICAHNALETSQWVNVVYNFSDQQAVTVPLKPYSVYDTKFTEEQRQQHRVCTSFVANKAVVRLDKDLGNADYSSVAIDVQITMIP